MARGPTRQAIGVFQDEPSLGAAVDDLLMSEFDRSEISVPVAREFDSAADHAAVWAYEPEAPSTAYIGNDARDPSEGSHCGGPWLLGRDGGSFG